LNKNIVKADAKSSQKPSVDKRKPTFAAATAEPAKAKGGAKPNLMLTIESDEGSDDDDDGDGGDVEV